MLLLLLGTGTARGPLIWTGAVGTRSAQGTTPTCCGRDPQLTKMSCRDVSPIRVGARHDPYVSGSRLPPFPHNVRGSSVGVVPCADPAHPSIPSFERY